VSDEATRLPDWQGDRTIPHGLNEMIGEMFGGNAGLRNAMGPEPGLDAKTSPAKTTRSRTGNGRRNETAGVCAKAFKTNAPFPLTRPTSLEMCYFQGTQRFRETPRKIWLATGSPSLNAGMNFQFAVDLMSPSSVS
jgi:hypothetical protein